MAKRFTDSEKWRKPWFRSLSLHGRMAWIYLTDNCDHAGVWPAAFDLMSGDLGFDVTAETLAEWFGDKLIQLQDDKFFLPGYIEFQYGELSTESKPHMSVIKILGKFGIDPKTLTLSKGYRSSTRTTKDKDKNKAKIKAKEEYTPEFEKCWAIYPRKDDKGDAFRAFQANVNADEHEKAYSAVLAYRAKLKRDGTDPKYYKLGATFYNKRRWFDVLTAAPPEDLSGNGSDDLESMVFTKPGAAS